MRMLGIAERLMSVARQKVKVSSQQISDVHPEEGSGMHAWRSNDYDDANWAPAPVKWKFSAERFGSTSSAHP